MSKRSGPPPPPPKKPSHLSVGATIATGNASTNVRKQINKRGIGWPWDYKAPYLNLFTNSKVSWLFNWELWVPEGLPNDGLIEWVPTVRTGSQAKDITPFLTDISVNRGVRINYLLGFNEPEIPDQANMSVEEAVRLWKEYVLPAKEKFGFRLGSPGVSSDTGRCKPWLDQFFATFGGPAQAGVDFLVVHWYGDRFESMASYLGEMHATYSLPIWMNEFAFSRLGAGAPTEEEVLEFVQLSVPWLDSLDWVERYAFFGNSQNQDVGEWVGRSNNFTRSANDCPGSGGRALTRIGRAYLEA